jgi:hypothetical protein
VASRVLLSFSKDSSHWLKATAAHKASMIARSAMREATASLLKTVSLEAVRRTMSLTRRMGDFP